MREAYPTISADLMQRTFSISAVCKAKDISLFLTFNNFKSDIFCPQESDEIPKTINWNCRSEEDDRSAYRYHKYK